MGSQVEEPVPEDRYRSLGTNPEQGEVASMVTSKTPMPPGVSGIAAMVVATP